MSRAALTEQVDRVHQGDTVNLMKTLPDGCAGLVIADPPYNLGPRFKAGKQWQRSPEWMPWMRTWLTVAVRLLRDGGNIFVYGIHHFTCFVQVELYEMGLSYRRQIIWRYENGFSSYSKNLAAHYEPILWFSKGADSTFHPIREPYKSTERLKYAINKGGKVWTPNPDGRLAGDVWDFPTLAGRRFRGEKVDHPTQKSLALTNRIVRHFSNPGDLVVVPFGGSGTECVSAKENGRHFWAAELVPEYVQLANSRLAAVAWNATADATAAAATAADAAAARRAAQPEKAPKSVKRRNGRASPPKDTELSLFA